MDDDQGEAVRHAVFDALAAALDAQLRAVRRLRRSEEGLPEPEPRQRRSQVDLVADVLKRAGEPLHINEILARIEQVHGAKLDRESVVSALTKKVHRSERFERVGPNKFGLRQEEEP